MFKENAKKDFCNVCCKKHVPWFHRNHVYTCKKQCEVISTDVKHPANEVLAESNYYDLCINVGNPSSSVYTYCDESFEVERERATCKIDACRLCCVTSDQIGKINVGIGVLDQCFSKCGQTFGKPEIQSTFLDDLNKENE